MFRNMCVVAVLSWVIGVESAEKQINAVSVDGSRVINTLSDHFFGHNYWMWAPSWGNQVSGTEALVSDLNLSFLRFGGIQVDLGYPDGVTESTMSQFIQYCNEVGAEPLVQIQIAKYATTEERVSNAVSMFNHYKTLYPVRYVAIGNEPDLYFDNLAVNPDYNAQYLSSYTVNDYCSDFNAVVTELKRIDPQITIVGLDLSHRYSEWIPPFLSQCRDNVDIISVHYYPYSAAQCTYDNVRNRVTVMENFYSSINSLIEQNSGGKHIPLIIGETNISWDGDPAASTRDASPGTFNAALWFADYVGVSCAQQNLHSIMPWSISEGWTLSFIPSNRVPKPVYHFYKMFSTFSRKHLIHRESVNQYVRVFIFRDDQNNVTVFTVNWDNNSSYPLTMTFSNILSDSTIHYEIPPHSFSAITISSDLAQKEIIEYRSSMENPTSAYRIEKTTPETKNRIDLSFRCKDRILTLFSQKSLNAARIDVLNMRGQTVQSISVKNVHGGVDLLVPLKDIPMGFYLIRVSSGNKHVAGKGVLLRKD